MQTRPTRGLRWTTWSATLALWLAAGPAIAQEITGDSGPADAYPLDELERVVEASGPVRCPKVDLVSHPGESIRYQSAVRVNPAFRERLRLFEAVAREVAVEVYGRAPRRIVHLGTLNCRRIAAWPTLLSEHGIGNAIDVAGFDFKPAPRGTVLPEGLPPGLRRAFRVRLEEHWTATDPAGAVHARFLRTLADRLVARPEIFRVLLGPSYPGHKNHFHFDCAPWRLVDI